MRMHNSRGLHFFAWNFTQLMGYVANIEYRLGTKRTIIDQKIFFLSLIFPIDERGFEGQIIEITAGKLLNVTKRENNYEK